MVKQGIKGIVAETSSVVPDRMIGCWKRRYIRFNDGTDDTRTIVLFVQTKQGVADLRIAADRINLSHRDDLESCNVDELIGLAAADCGCGITLFHVEASPYPTATWEAGEYGFAYQPVVNFPEPGWFEWRENDTCLMEWAPSGAYEEDWRLAAHSQSFAAHLMLKAAPSKTGLYIAGDHAVFTRDRALAADEEIPLQQLVAKYRYDIDKARALVDSEISYAVRQDNGDYEIELSTFPWREGTKLALGWVDDIKRGESNIVDPTSGDTWQIVSLWFR